MAKIPNIGILQINLRRSRSAHDLAIKTARDRGAGIIIISEQDRGAHNAMWFQDKRGNAALYVCEDELYDAKELSTGNGYVGVVIGQLAIYSCYFSPNVPDVLVELDMARLAQEIGRWKGPIIVAGDFNSKARAWTAGPHDSRGNFLEELMAEYNLTAVNQPGVYTYEKEASRSVLDLTFASPEVMRGIVEWEVLDKETRSDHRYVFVKIAGNRNRRREN